MQPSNQEEDTMKIKTTYNAIENVKAAVDFPTKDGTVLGKPEVCITVGTTSIVIPAKEFKRVSRKLNKHLKTWRQDNAG